MVQKLKDTFNVSMILFASGVLFLTAYTTFAAPPTTKAAKTKSAQQAKQSPAAQQQPPQQPHAAQPQQTPPPPQSVQKQELHEETHQAEHQEHHEDIDSDEDGRIWHVGPVVGANLPRLINFGVQARFWKHLGLEINYGFFPQITISNVKAKDSGFDFFSARVFPFGGAFFLGAALGKLTINATGTDPSLPNTEVYGEINRTYLTPMLGFRWGGTKGLTFGIDVGVVLSLKTDVAITSNQPIAAVQSTPQYSNINSFINDYKDTPLPNVTVLQFGYLF